jgi:hypothetical protein
MSAAPDFVSQLGATGDPLYLVAADALTNSAHHRTAANKNHQQQRSRGPCPQVTPFAC